VRVEDRGPLLVRPPGADCPMPVGRDVDISKVAETQLETIVRDPYPGDDPRFQGKSRLEATLLSLADDAPHDPEARKELLDRVMGKPRQRVDSTNVNITLSGFLQEIDSMEMETATVIDVTPEEDEEEMFR
jgi:hypothetical protein